MEIRLDGPNRNTLVQFLHYKSKGERNKKKEPGGKSKDKKKKRLLGTVVCIKHPDNTLTFGWSKYRDGVEKKVGVTFSKEEGRERAITRAIHGAKRMYDLTLCNHKEQGDVPQFICIEAPKFIRRCTRYFKTDIVRNVKMPD